MGGSRGGQGVQTSSLKNHKNIRFPSNTGPDPLKKHKATKRAIIGMAAKRHVDVGPLMVVFASSQKKKRFQSWTPSDKTFWIRALQLGLV